MGFFRAGVRFKNFFETYLCRESTLVLEIQFILFIFDSAKFGTFCAFFWPFRAIFGVRVRFKNFLKPAYIDNAIPQQYCAPVRITLSSLLYVRFQFFQIYSICSNKYFYTLDTQFFNRSQVNTGAIFWVGVGFNNCFGVYLCS